MGVRPITDTGWRMINSLPMVLRQSADYQAVLHAASREVDRMEASIEQIRMQFNPAQADLLLGAWEMQVRLPVGGYGATIAQRQARVVFRLQKLKGASEGREWERAITDLAGQGWTYEEHIPGDPSSPPADTLRIQLPFAPSGSAYAEALAQIREITPAHLEIEFQTLGGFELDQSELDLEEMTY